MKLVSIDAERVGLLLQLCDGPHIVDIAKSLSIFTHRDPLAGALIRGALKEKSAWVAIVNGWPYLRRPLQLLAHAALANPADPQLTIYPYTGPRSSPEQPHGIVSIDITDAEDIEIQDPTGRFAMVRQFGEAVDHHVQPDATPMGANVTRIDFSRRKAVHTSA